MEVRCSVCGTINESTNPFCKGCFLPLHKTMEQYTEELENKINSSLEKMEPVKEEDEKVKEELVEESIREDVWKQPISGETTVIPIIEPDFDEPEFIEEIKKDETKPIKEDLNEELEPEPIKQEKLDIVRPIESKRVETIKDDLKSVSIVNENSNQDNNFKEKEPIALALSFNVILIIATLIFSYFYGIKINDTTDILFGALTTILFSSFSIFIVFRKSAPIETKTNVTLVVTFLITTLFEIVFRCYQLYISDLAYLYIYVFTVVLYLLASVMIVNAISRFIRKNRNEFEPSKFISIFNLIILIIIVLLSALGVWSMKKQTVIREDKEAITDEDQEIPEELYQYVEELNSKILENIQNDENYEIPPVVTDINFIESAVELDSVSLAIDDYGTVSSGEIKYNGKRYRYKNTKFYFVSK